MSKSVFFKAKEIQEEWLRDPHSPAHRFVAEELDNYMHSVSPPLMESLGSGSVERELTLKVGQAVSDLIDELTADWPMADPLEFKITAILEKNDGLCMDNEEERNKLARVLARELK